jgi:hypothetical protein
MSRRQVAMKRFAQGHPSGNPRAVADVLSVSTMTDLDRLEGEAP